MLEPHHESPLAHAAESAGTYVSIREIDARGMIDLRGLATDRKFMTAAKQVLGLDLPKQARSSVAFGEIKALWLSPDQWLILCAREKAEILTKDLQSVLAPHHALVVDVSDMRCIIRLEGKAAREVLMKSGSLDFTDADFTPGYSRRMRFAEIAALFNIVDETTIDLYVFRSYAQYAVNFLHKASRFGSEVGISR